MNIFSMHQIAGDDDADEDVCHYEFPGTGRLVLDTIHGRIIIDVRANDVNSFVFEGGTRVDRVLLKEVTPTST